MLRKLCDSDLFRLKYDENWLHMYELAKVSLNNRGNELKSNERKSGEGSEISNRSLLDDENQSDNV